MNLVWVDKIMSIYTNPSAQWAY